MVKSIFFDGVLQSLVLFAHLSHVLSLVDFGILRSNLGPRFVVDFESFVVRLPHCAVHVVLKLVLRGKPLLGASHHGVVLGQSIGGTGIVVL